MEPFELDFFLFLSFKSGSARGPYQLEIRVQEPSGESPQPFVTIQFEGEDDRGNDIVANMKMRFEMTGLYWFNV